MVSHMRLGFLFALQAWLANSDEHRCTCAVEVPAFPEPNRAVLELLEKQLDRCGPEHQRVVALSQAALSAFPTGAGALAWTIILLFGIMLGRLSYMVVPFTDKERARFARSTSGKSTNAIRDPLLQFLGRTGVIGPTGNAEGRTKITRITNTEGNAEVYQGYQDYQENQTEAVKQMDEFRSPEGDMGTRRFDDYPEPGPEGDMASGRYAPAAAGAAEEGDSSLCRLDDDEDEEKLGIIDAGDEEWIEVHDVIREHSAVTIFNHTDSTWYVSSKHPHFVRPLHGKRRHPPSRQPHLRTWSMQNGGSSMSEASPFRQNQDGSEIQPQQQQQQQQEDMQQQEDPSMVKDEEGYGGYDYGSSQPRATFCPSVQGGSFRGASHVQRMQRRPRSAPSPAYGRSDQDPQIPAGSMLHQASTSGHRPDMRSTDSHHRCASADLAHLSATIREDKDELGTRTSSREEVAFQPKEHAVPGMHDGPDGVGGPSLRQVRSASPPIYEDRSYDHED